MEAEMVGSKLLTIVDMLRKERLGYTNNIDQVPAPAASFIVFLLLFLLISWKHS